MRLTEEQRTGFWDQSYDLEQAIKQAQHNIRGIVQNSINLDRPALEQWYSDSMQSCKLLAIQWHDLIKDMARTIAAAPNEPDLERQDDWSFRADIDDAPPF